MRNPAEKKRTSACDHDQRLRVTIEKYKSIHVSYENVISKIETVPILNHNGKHHAVKNKANKSTALKRVLKPISDAVGCLCRRKTNQVVVTQPDPSDGDHISTRVPMSVPKAFDVNTHHLREVDPITLIEEYLQQSEQSLQSMSRSLDSRLCEQDLVGILSDQRVRLQHLLQSKPKHEMALLHDILNLRAIEVNYDDNYK